MATSLPIEHSFLAPEMTRHATAPDLYKVSLHEPKTFPEGSRLLQLSDGETGAFRHLAHSMVSRTLAHESEYRRMKCPGGDWKLLKRQDALRIYKHRSSKCGQAQAPVPNRPMVLCVGSVPGTLEELLYGLHAKTRAEMQATIPLMSRDYLRTARCWQSWKRGRVLTRTDSFPSSGISRVALETPSSPLIAICACWSRWGSPRMLRASGTPTTSSKASTLPDAHRRQRIAASSEAASCSAVSTANARARRRWTCTPRACSPWGVTSPLHSTTRRRAQ
jgi:hypothetical protein